MSCLPHIGSEVRLISCIAHDKRAFNGEKEKLKDLGSIRITLDFARVLNREGKKTEAENTKDLGIVSGKALATQDRPISHHVK